MTVDEFKDLLKKHDWYYMMSDDPGMYNTGRLQAKKIQDAMKDNPEFQKIYDEYRRK